MHKDTVNKMINTQAVLQETMRLYNPVPLVLREANKDDQLIGFTIKKGTRIMPVLENVHHHEWQNALEYRPERFLPQGEYDSFPESIRPYKFLAFI